MLEVLNNSNLIKKGLKIFGNCNFGQSGLMLTEFQVLVC